MRKPTDSPTPANYYPYLFMAMSVAAIPVTYANTPIPPCCLSSAVEAPTQNWSQRRKSE